MVLRSLALALCAAWWTTGARAQVMDGPTSCEQAAQSAEMAYGLPTGLLAAIGRVESGRRDPTSGRVRPWPWTLNANGAGAYWPDSVSAVNAVESLHARGVTSIDVGCFQINLVHHPNAFPTLFDAFVPSTNADYAARFLVDLRQRTGDWGRAVMAYHSATPALGEAYWTQVQASWGSPGARSPTGLVQAIPAFSSSAPVHVWTPGIPGTGPNVLQLGTVDAPLPVITYFLSRGGARSTGS